MAVSPRDTETLAQTFRILSDPTRVRIVSQLQDGEMNVSQLCNKLKAPQPTVSRHLAILRMGGLVTNRRQGKEIFYSIADLKKSDQAKALDRFIKKSSALRIGPLVLAVAKR
jgi:ArsR family transcriptional regulator